MSLKQMKELSEGMAQTLNGRTISPSFNTVHEISPREDVLACYPGTTPHCHTAVRRDLPAEPQVVIPSDGVWHGLATRVASDGRKKGIGCRKAAPFNSWPGWRRGTGMKRKMVIAALK